MQSQIESELQPKLRQAVSSLDVQRLVIGAIAALNAVIGEGSILSAQAASLTHWSFDPAVNQLEITVKDGTTPRYFLMAQPARIVVDLPDTAVGNVSTQKTYAGVVRQIRVSQFEPGLTRIVMEISPGVSLAPGQVKLQKVGDRATQASNSRWVLSPLVTKAFSANAVSPSSSAPSSPADAAIAPAAPGSLDRSPPTPAVIPNNLPAPPPLASSPAATDTATTTTASPTNVAPDSGNNQPAGATVSVPTAPVTLAPVLPASPTQRTETATPLPPNTVTPIDPNMAINTSGGVAIAIPSPAAVPAPNVAPQAPQAVVPPAASPPAASSPALTAADIPITVAVRPSTVAPSVSVPPLSVSPLSDRVQSDRSVPQSTPLAPARPPEAASGSLPAFPTAANSQPNVSVPPLIRVGTPSLGIPTNQPGLEVAPNDPSSSPAPSSVSVPPLQQATALSASPSGTTNSFYDASTVRQPASATPLVGTTGVFYDANTVRQPPSSTINLAPPLSLAPLQPPVAPPIAVPIAAPTITTPTYDANTVRQPPTSLASATIVAFGQPLPATSETARVSGQPLAAVNQSPGVRQAFKPTAPNVLLPAGTSLSLLYPGSAALTLRTDRPQQEVLVLQTDLRDGSGNLLAPAGSLVTGQFETTTAGSQFVTQAIALTGRSLPLVAQSEPLDGTRQVTGNNLALNSGIGVLAGGVLGAIGGSAGLGAIGGAAAGAAATLITAPKPAMIQPGQIVQVRLTQDLSSEL